VRVIEFKKEDDRKVMREEVQKLYDRVMSGDVESLIFVIETGKEYEHCRCNMTYEHALGLLARASHKLNEEWSAG
jgi:hypothetical protein